VNELIAGYTPILTSCSFVMTEVEELDGPPCLNPTVIIEVLSPFNRKHDRGKKFPHISAGFADKKLCVIDRIRRGFERYLRSKPPNGECCLRTVVGLEAVIDVASINEHSTLATLRESQL